MVRSIILTLAAVAACVGFFIFVEWYISSEFGTVYEAVDALYDKVEDGKATSEDANAVRSLWADKRSKLHNDIAYVDYRLNEAYSYVYTGNYPLALANLEIVRRMTETLPDNYKLKLENIF